MYEFKKSISNLLYRFRDRILRIYTDDYVRINRHRTAIRVLKWVSHNSTPLTDEQKNEIITFWKPYHNIKKEMGWFEFYNTSCQDKDKLKYYIPDTLYYCDIDTYFTDARRCEALDDKNLYDIYFHDIKQPTTIIRKINGELLDKDYNIITFDQALELCKINEQVVGKKAINSCGGHGVHFFDFSSPEGIEKFKTWLSKTDTVKVEQVLQQHETLSAIHDKSINTIRIMSMFLDGKIIILSSLLRMGAGGSRVDNGSSGGVFCGIDPKDGTLRETGHYTDGRSCKQHPQGLVFKGFKVVGYERCREIVEQIAGRMFTASRLISWDFAIGVDGEPILIETNLTYGGLSTHLLSNGPLFGDMTPDILDRVFRGKK
jgi:hypothetical protein